MKTRTKKRNSAEVLILGRTWESIKRAQRGGILDKPVDISLGDYGCDPLGNGLYRMVPSGKIVTKEEKEKQLRGLRRHLSQ